MKKLLLTLLMFLGFNQDNTLAATYPDGTSAFSFSFESIDGSQWTYHNIREKLS